MSGGTSIFEEAIECLDYSRKDTIAEARNIPDDRWDYRPHPTGPERRRARETHDRSRGDDRR